MSNEKRFEEIKRRVTKLENEASEAKGRYDALVDQIKDEFGVSSVRAAKGLLTKLEKEASAAEDSFNNLLQEFETKYAEHLGLDSAKG